MANLVSPGYKESKLVNQVLAPYEERFIEFLGLDRKPVISDGEMSNMWNLTSDNYPLLTPRKPRGKYALPDDVTIPLQIMTRFGKVAMIAKDENNAVNFYYNKNKIAAVTGLTEQTRMAIINTKICFFPQKTYLEVTSNATTVTIGSYGNLEEKYTASTAIDVEIDTNNVRVTLGADHNFKYDDAVDINGTLYFTEGGSQSTATCNVSCIIEEVTGRILSLPRDTFIELIGTEATDVTFVGVIKREMPDLDFVIEWNNRLWGASSLDNTIYACKLGDPRNWTYYQGTSMDSYYAQQGTDGVWTGCAPYSSHIIFFKQNSMTKVYGSSPSSFQIVNVQCYGVEEGSRRSVAVFNDRVFYKSIMGIMAYDGGIPYCISDNFNITFKNVVGGCDGKKYYASIQDANGYELMVLDIEKALWHKEDNIRMQDVCTLDNKLLFIAFDSDPLKCSNDAICSEWLLCGSGNPSSGDVHIVNPDNAYEDASAMTWMAVFGPFDEFVENRKIYSKILLRLAREAESEVSIYISINEGDWELVQKFSPTSTGGDYIPIIPRRCDRYSIKIEGKGACSIKSLTRCVRRGTGGRL